MAAYPSVRAMYFLASRKGLWLMLTGGYWGTIKLISALYTRRPAWKQTLRLRGKEHTSATSTHCFSLYNVFSPQSTVSDFRHLLMWSWITQRLNTLILQYARQKLSRGLTCRDWVESGFTTQSSLWSRRIRCGNSYAKSNAERGDKHKSSSKNDVPQVAELRSCKSCPKSKTIKSLQVIAELNITYTQQPCCSLL